MGELDQHCVAELLDVLCIGVVTSYHSRYIDVNKEFNLKRVKLSLFRQMSIHHNMEKVAKVLWVQEFVSYVVSFFPFSEDTCGDGYFDLIRIVT